MASSDHPPPLDPSIRPGELFEGRFGDRLDGLTRLLDRWRARPWASSGAGAAVVAVVVLGWWLGRPSSAGPVDDRIPFAPGVVTTATVGAPPAGGGATPPGAAATSGSPAAGEGTGAGLGTGSDPDGVVPAPVAELVVHVAGAVARPGIVRLEPGDRVIDAVDAAGGPTAEADVDQLNLAAPVSDGLQIRVPRLGETVTSPTGVAPTSAPPGPGGSAAGLIQLNLASPAELDSLPGIGPALAAAIVRWRDENGPFATVDGLLDVPGIGPAKLAALADLVTV